MNMKTSAPLFACLFGIALPLGASATTIVDNTDAFALTGILHGDILNLNGTTSGVSVDLGAGPQDTGDISLKLDPVGNSFFEYDLDRGTVAERLELIATFPLQTTLGLDPVPILIEEIGFIDGVTLLPTFTGDVIVESSHEGFITQSGRTAQPTTGTLAGTASQPVSDPFAHFEIQSILSGGGVVAEGPFSGFAFDNINIMINIGHGAGNGNRVTVPEPPTPISLFLGGVVFLLFGKALLDRYSLQKE